ncbi:HEAT repeat domain-containing protein [Nocardioides pocheonensis]|uniref:HEAT repeat domain-containing protein n=1 Tax=Nocardioides pocheonensis TaxID=661485 RepID=A0A3N0GKH9_9ACTN|nr:HEAT repeat domain-containing protein [Nocardioides pocheonensis]RNM12716.1 HEAT repeat domain-containing protein [Nocardioides pocheonensis]
MVAAILSLLLTSACGQSMKDTIARTKDASLTVHQRCTAMDDLAFEGKRAVAPLHELTHDPNAEVATCARKAIAGIFDSGAADALVPLLADDDPRVVVSATEALGQIGKRSTVPALVPLLQSPNRQVEIEALHALGTIGDKKVVPAIEEVALRRGATPAEDKAGRKVRIAAVGALGNLGDQRARTTLVRVLGSDPACSRAAGASLAALYQDDVTPLLPLLQERRHVALAFGLVDIGQEGTEDSLVAALHRFGDLELAEYYLNCGNRRLEKAARTWADDHGYSVLTHPGVGGDEWGSASD